MALASGRFALFVCDRCAFEYPYREARADGNSPGLRVCPQCRDNIDPYRLPARQPDPIALRYPRPEEDIAIEEPAYILTETYFVIATNEGNPLIT